MKSKNRKNKLVSLLISVIFVISLIPVSAAAAEYSDISGHWAHDAIVRWSDYGVLKGSDGKFRPNDTVTRAELAAVLNRMLKYPAQTENPYTGIKATDWFYSDVLALAKYDIVRSENNVIKPNEALTREEAAYMVGKAFGVPTEYSGDSGFTDLVKISPWAKLYVISMKKQGFISGMPDGSFSPKNKITRAQVVTILNNMVDNYIYQAGTYSIKTGNSGTLVNCAGVILNYANIANNSLFVSPGIGTEKLKVIFYSGSKLSIDEYVVGLAKDAVKIAEINEASETDIATSAYAKSLVFTDISDVVADKRFSGGNGSPSHPYLIESQTQLAYLNGFCDPNIYTYFKLVNDISITGNWIPISGGDYGFSGELDGAGHTITYSTKITGAAPYYAGLFCSLLGTVKNLKIISLVDADMSSISEGYGAKVGGITGVLTGSVENCNVEATIYVKNGGDTKAGGIAGINYGSIENCSVAGLITVVNGSAKDTGSYAGGIVGGNGYGSIEYCYSSAAVLSKGGVSTESGGIAGYILGSADDERIEVTITNCYATGTVTAQDASGSNTAGGVAGSMDYGIMSSCWADATVTASGNSYTITEAAGLSGECGYAGTIRNCWASAKSISATGNNAVCSGLVGSNHGLLENCFVCNVKTFDIKEIGSAFRIVDGTTSSCYDFTGLSAAKKTAIYNKCGWDFTTVWNKDAAAYPILRGVGEAEQIKAMQ